jgi:alpha-beta hydrolase superfamily lysophospholipase
MQDASRLQPPFRPVYIGQAGLQSFGLFHAADSQHASDHALLICPSFGTEDVNAYLSLRLLAEATASAGIPTLRLDYVGCGQADGDADTPGLFMAWQDSIVEAVAALRTLSGARRISVLGLRLGALLASLAAPRCGGLNDLIAVAPVVSGRAYVREMKALHMAGLAGLTLPASDAPAVFESGGFVMAEATHQALSAVDLLKLDAPPTARMLVIERDDLPGPATKWAARLIEQGVQIEQDTLSDYATMMADPHRCITPASLVDRVLERLRSAPVDGLDRLERGDSSDAGDAAASSPCLPKISSSLLTNTEDGSTVAVREEPVFIGDHAALFGILSRADQGPKASRTGLAILMVNAGATRAIGPNRLHVPLARHWAAQGHAALRLDIAGLGDSPVHTGHPDNTVYSETALEDIAQALRWLRQQAGVERIVLMGLCSGAYHALKAVVNKLPADAVVMINPLTFFWKEGMSLEPSGVNDARVALDMMRHRQSLWRRETWMKLLRGGLSAQRLAQIARQALAWVTAKAYRGVARRVGLPMKDDLGRELMQLAARQMPMHFIFSETDPGLSLLRAQAGTVVEQLERQGRLHIRLIPYADHTFTWAAPRQQLQDLLKDTISALA